MTSTTKSTIIIIGVFLIGIVVGAFSTTSYTRYYHKKKIMEFRSGRGFIDEVLRLIEMKPEQRKEVDEILQRHAEWNRKFNEEQHTKFITGMDSLKTELTSVLSEEQVQDLDQKLKMMRDRQPGPGRGPEGPPPGFEPGGDRPNMPPPPNMEKFHDCPPMDRQQPPMDNEHHREPPRREK